MNAEETRRAWIGLFVASLFIHLGAWIAIACYFLAPPDEPVLRVEKTQNDSHSYYESRLFLCRITLYKETNGVYDAVQSGTGCLAIYKNQKYLITARHVFIHYDEGRASLAGDRCTAVFQDHVLYIKAKDFYLDSEYDLAIIAVSRDAATDLMIAPDLDFQFNDEIDLFGFPGGKFMQSKGNIRYLDTKQNYIFHTAFSWRGSSGGPLVKKTNNQKILVGIHSATLPERDYDGTFLRGAVHQRAIIEVIEKIKSTNRK